MEPSLELRAGHGVRVPRAPLTRGVIAALCVAQLTIASACGKLLEIEGVAFDLADGASSDAGAPDDAAEAAADREMPDREMPDGP